MWLIVGLGNPGNKYALTRHNVGFMAVDFIHRSLEAPATKTDFKAIVNRFKWDGEEIVTAQPQTFMNLSGESVQPLMAFYKITPDKIVVIQDDIDQPFGQLRFHKNRGHGGHNGIRDISAKLGTMDYVRLKIGVGRPPHPEFPVADYVLQKFSDDEMKALPDVLNRAVDALECLLFEGLQKASTKFNG